MGRKKERKMAIATEELLNGTATNDETPNEPQTNDNDEIKAKREKVDLEALDPNDRVQFSCVIPAGMKLALLKAGEDNKLSGSAYARDLLANAIGYQIPDSFTERTREHKYASEEDRKEATAKAAKEKREMMKKILDAAKSGKLDLSALGISLPS